MIPRAEGATARGLGAALIAAYVVTALSPLIMIKASGA